MSVSVIISNLNGAKFLPRLLETLEAQQAVDLEIIVVDRFSTDNSLEILSNFPTVKITSERPETGLVAGYHAGSLIATKNHYFFCNEDMWFDSQCLKYLENAIDLEKRIALADPWQWTYDGKEWIHGGVRFSPAVFEMNCPYPRRRHNFTVPLVNGDIIPFGCAGALMIHKEVYEEIGGWPQDFFLDHEDVDLGIRLWQHGWVSVTVPESKVYHAVGMSNNQILPTKSTNDPSSSINKTNHKINKQSVRARRFRSGRSSLMIMTIKYFSGTSIFWGYFTIFVAIMKSILRLRLGQLQMELLIFEELRERMPAAITFRSQNQERNKKYPGEKFFIEEKFQI